MRKDFCPTTVRVTTTCGDAIEVALEPLPEFEDQVVVNASRSPTRIQDQPLRVEVIDREEIEEKALMTPGSVAMLIGETTGLRVQPTAPSLGAANVRIQGLRGRYSQLLADGLPLYGGQGDSFSLLQVPPLDLGQVEIIKGPHRRCTAHRRSAASSISCRGGRRLPAARCCSIRRRSEEATRRCGSRTRRPVAGPGR